MSRPSSPDYEKALTLLKAALGEFKPELPLKRIISSVPDFGPFEWMLTILGLEIDLRVDIPESLADNKSRSAGEFCKKVAQLPKVDSPGYTLECLGMVAQALLSLEVGADPNLQRSSKGAARKKATRRSTVPSAKKAPRRAATPAAKKAPRRAATPAAKKAPRRTTTLATQPRAGVSQKQRSRRGG